MADTGTVIAEVAHLMKDNADLRRLLEVSLEIEHDYSAKIISLEEQNAALQAEIEDWKDACGIVGGGSPDAVRVEIRESKASFADLRRHSGGAEMTEPADKPITAVSVAWLRNRNACHEQVAIVKAEWGIQRIALTRKNLLRAAELRLDLGWLASEVIKGAEPWRIYSKAIAEARRIYSEAIAEPRRIYSEAIVEPRRIYSKATAEPRRIYSKATAEAWRIYHEATAEAQRIYDESTAEALYLALGGQEPT